MLERDGQQLSASQARQRVLANADHLAILNAIWIAETAPVREQHYRHLLVASLPPEHRREPGRQVRWLWRTIRAAELAGLDIREVLAAAIGERDLAGARDLAAVIDARLRYRTGAFVPAPAGPWSAQVPALADPDRRAYLTEIAAMMDARKDRIGEHAAEQAPPWAVYALGPVPEDPLDRLDWQRRAASIGAWRELSGYHDPPTRWDQNRSRPPPTCGPPGTRPSPPWLPGEGPDVRGMPNGLLWHLRDTYPIETAWAPQYVGDKLRQVRAAARDARLAGLRAGVEAAAARDARLAGLRASVEAAAAQQRGDHQEAVRKQELADSYQALHDAYRQREAVFAATIADRGDWQNATVQQRHLAVAADAELRRRHPDQHYPPLRSAEPQPAADAQCDEFTPTAGEQTRDAGQLIKDLAAAHRTFADRLAYRLSLTIPSEDPD